jgi:thiol-disulfide isomerase/thioredoxin
MKYTTLLVTTLVLTCTQALFAGTKKEAIDLLSAVHTKYQKAGALVEQVVVTFPAIKDGAAPLKQVVKLALTDDSGQVSSDGVLKIWDGESLFVEFGNSPEAYLQVDAKSMQAALDTLSGYGDTPWSVPLRDSRVLKTWVAGLCMSNSVAEVIDVSPDTKELGSQIILLKSDNEKALVHVSSENIVTKVVNNLHRGGEEFIVTRDATTNIYDKVPAIKFDTAGKTRVKTFHDLKIRAENQKTDTASKDKTKEKKLEAAPDFTLQTLDGSGSVTLSDLKGKVVVLDFWATWCGPCRRGLPLLNEYDAEYGSDLVKVFAVNVWERGDKKQWLEAVQTFWKDNKYKTAVLLASEDKSLSEKYGVTGIPTTVVIDTNGNIFKIHKGFTSEMISDLKKSVEGAFKASK